MNKKKINPRLPGITWILIVVNDTGLCGSLPPKNYKKYYDSTDADSRISIRLIKRR